MQTASPRPYHTPNHQHTYAYKYTHMSTQAVFRKTRQGLCCSVALPSPWDLFADGVALHLVEVRHTMATLHHHIDHTTHRPCTRASARHTGEGTYGRCEHYAVLVDVCVCAYEVEELPPQQLSQEAHRRLSVLALGALIHLQTDTSQPQLQSCGRVNPSCVVMCVVCYLL